MLNNADWLDRLGYIALLRDVGVHFSVTACCPSTPSAPGWSASKG